MSFYGISVKVAHYRAQVTQIAETNTLSNILCGNKCEHSRNLELCPRDDIALSLSLSLSFSRTDFDHNWDSNVRSCPLLSNICPFPLFSSCCAISDAFFFRAESLSGVLAFLLGLFQNKILFWKCEVLFDRPLRIEGEQNQRDSPFMMMRRSNP